MSAKTIWLCAGLAGGVLLTLVVQFAFREPEEPARAAPSGEPALVADLRAEVGQLRDQYTAEQKRADRAQDQVNQMTAKVDELTNALKEACGDAEAPPPAPEAPTAPPTDDEIMKGVGEFGESLVAILRGGGEHAKKELRELLARGGDHAIELLTAKFEDDATDIQLRSVLAHALAQSGNEKAIGVLTGILGDPEAGMLELRLATHGLAFSDAPGIDDALLGVAHRSADTGARANASFGLARRKHPAGVDLYAKAMDEAVANRDPAALQYVSGFVLLGDEGLPVLRERLLTYDEPQLVVSFIEVIKMKGDTGALENLRKLAADEGKPESIRRAAEGAIKALGGSTE